MITMKISKKNTEISMKSLEEMEIISMITMYTWMIAKCLNVVLQHLEGKWLELSENSETDKINDLVIIIEMCQV